MIWILNYLARAHTDLDRPKSIENLATVVLASVSINNYFTNAIHLIVRAHLKFWFSYISCKHFFFCEITIVKAVQFFHYYMKTQKEASPHEGVSWKISLSMECQRHTFCNSLKVWFSITRWISPLQGRRLEWQNSPCGCKITVPFLFFFLNFSRWLPNE